jgi:ketosteroid isomerase-like protein
LSESSERTAALVRRGFEAWARGDLAELETLMHPDVELFWYEPGDWDCHGRETVLALLRRRLREGRPVFAVRVDTVDADTIVVSARDPAERRGGDLPTTATRVSIRDGRIMTMRQYRSREEALAVPAE